MKEYLIEVINYVPSYYPFETKDNAIGLANFYAQKPTENFRKLHDDITYRRYIQTCDVVGVPVGPCNKLLKGNLIPCLGGGGGGAPARPLPLCDNEGGFEVVCRCYCPGACLTDADVPGTNYIENFDRDTLLQFIDSASSYPEGGAGGNSSITHELAGNGYWIGLQPSCTGVWVSLSDCETGAFIGFYQFSGPDSSGNIKFGIDYGVTLRGRGQRIKIPNNESTDGYDRYQVYYAYEFAYQLGLTPPNEMTFKLAPDNIFEQAENDFIIIPTEPEGGIAEEGDTSSNDFYSRFCGSIFYPVVTKGCIRTTENIGGPGKKPCVCEEPYKQELPPEGEDPPYKQNKKYIRDNDIDQAYKDAGLFALDTGRTTACEGVIFERENAAVDAPGLLPIDITEEFKYYDAFSRATIYWSEEIGETGNQWSTTADTDPPIEQDYIDNWNSWKVGTIPVLTWEDDQIHDNCHKCLSNKKKNGTNDPGVPPCENVNCGRIEINANPDPNLFDSWKELDIPPEGGLSADPITKSEAAEWDFFAKFGFPTLEEYTTNETENNNSKWYDEIKARFLVLEESNLAQDTYTFVREGNQYTIPCFPKKPCEPETLRITQVFDEVRSCGEGWDGERHSLYIGADLSIRGCAKCPDCYPPGCCIDPSERYSTNSSPIPLMHEYVINTNYEDQEDNTETYKQYSQNFEKNTNNNFECYVKGCSPDDLEENFNMCLFRYAGDMQKYAECLEEAANKCALELDMFLVSNNGENYKCNNFLDPTLFTRVIETNMWFYNGISLEACGSPGPSNIKQCVYEVEPLRPSAAKYLDINQGQCHKKTEETSEDCTTITQEWKDPRTDPYLVGITANTGCPPGFTCNRCVRGLSATVCKCCGVYRFADEDTDRATRFLSDECDTGTCPKCCSMCSENEEGIHNCDDMIIDPNSQCYISDCEIADWNLEDCVTLIQNIDGKYTYCAGDVNPCQQEIDERQSLDCGNDNNSGGFDGGIG